MVGEEIGHSHFDGMASMRNVGRVRYWYDFFIKKEACGLAFCILTSLLCVNTVTNTCSLSMVHCLCF